MIKVKFTFPWHYNFPIERQVPYNSKCQFFINPETDINFDWWVIFDDLEREEETICDKQNTILITGEPPSIKKYNPRFISQFRYVITPHKVRKKGHKKIQLTPWMIGIEFDKRGYLWNNKDYWSHDFLEQTTFEKSKLLSIILSNKNFTSGHRQRLVFLDHLKSYFGNDIDIYGKGYKEIKDKKEGLIDYKYTIALENSSSKNYWTEKLADAYLANTFPFYYGCPNIHRFFNRSSFASIDIFKPTKSINIIERSLDKELYEKRYTKILHAKKKVLYDYNLFHYIENYILQMNRKQIPASSYTKLLPANLFTK